MNEISPVSNTTNIRYADFVRVTTPTDTYLFSTAPYAITVPAVDLRPFDGLGQLVKIGDATRDIKSTANETSISLVGIDTALLGWVLGQNIKGSKIEMWHGFFNTNDQLIGGLNYLLTESGYFLLLEDGGKIELEQGTSELFKFFTGYITSFQISEQWMDEQKAYVGTINVSASNIQLILNNRTAGRYTNDNAWQFFTPGDTSMNRVATIQQIQYFFGKQA